ncbi:MAG: L-alanine exporter AlaE [Deltaproteobacteria bacterium]|nr:L-alanine exporter AlaE [Deltaproteobacteria bacterium]
MRQWIVDTMAMVVFSTVVGMLVEVLVSGLSISQSLDARLMAVPLNLLTARPYGVYRDRVLAVLAAPSHDAHAVRRTAADVLAFVSFQVPIYALILSVSGARLAQIATSCATVALLSTFMGRPYGVFLDACRRLAALERSCSCPRENDRVPSPVRGGLRLRCDRHPR